MLCRLVIFLTAKVKKLPGTISCKFMKQCSASNFKKLNLRSVKLQATFSCQHDDKKKSLTKNFNFKSGSAFMLNYLWCYLQCRKWCNLKPLYGRQNSYCVEATTACISRKRQQKVKCIGISNKHFCCLAKSNALNATTAKSAFYLDQQMQQKIQQLPKHC